MEHRMRPGLLHGNLLSLLAPLSSSEDRGCFLLSTKFLSATVLLSILIGPFAVVSMVVTMTKPSGSLSGDHNTVFWLLSSIALGFAIALGATALTWFFRTMSQISMDLLLPLVRETSSSSSTRWEQSMRGSTTKACRHTHPAKACPTTSNGPAKRRLPRPRKRSSRANRGSSRST